jgi:hypothetical protein
VGTAEAIRQQCLDRFAEARPAHSQTAGRHAVGNHDAADGIDHDDAIGHRLQQRLESRPDELRVAQDFLLGDIPFARENERHIAPGVAQRPCG